MARAHRHYIPGNIWHIIHRCHERAFLLKYVKDRHRWLQWRFEERIRYGPVILNYAVTSNHIHLLTYDDQAQGIIPKSMQLISGRVGKEYNQRKNRKCAFWEDRYHPTIIESGDHLLRCIVYIDMNRVRVGVVNHPAQWRHGGYNEIQSPRRKCILIDYYTLSRLARFDDFRHFQARHLQWINVAIENQTGLSCDSKWTRSMSYGSEAFLKKLKRKMHVMLVWDGVRLEYMNRHDKTISY